MLQPVWSGRFKPDVRRAEKRGKDMEKLKTAIALLVQQVALPASCNAIASGAIGRAIATSISNGTGCCSIPSRTMSSG